jgi:hypothetical protein
MRTENVGTEHRKETWANCMISNDPIFNEKYVAKFLMKM